MPNPLKAVTFWPERAWMRLGVAHNGFRHGAFKMCMDGRHFKFGAQKLHILVPKPPYILEQRGVYYARRLFLLVQMGARARWKQMLFNSRPLASRIYNK